MTSATNVLPRSLDWVIRLCSIDSTSRLSNLPVIDVVAEEARRLGLDPKICPGPTTRRRRISS